MKNFLLVFFTGFALNVFAQTIPYATQQPKWVFPVYAQDATGKRDTIYLGHNPGSSCVVEPQFGEIWFQGVNDFSLSTDFWLDPVDSTMKTNVLDEPLYYDCGYGITLSNVVMPVTFYWDVSLMRSDSLPFPDQDPAPRAQLYIGYNGGLIIDEPGMICDPQFPIVATDSISNESYGCFVKDSLRLVDLFGNTNPQSFGLSFEINPWTGNGPLSINENSKSDINIYPNPVTDKINIKGLNYDSYEITIYDILSNEYLNIIYKGLFPEIEISQLNCGIYFLSIRNNDDFFEVLKFIKA